MGRAASSCRARGRAWRPSPASATRCSRARRASWFEDDLALRSRLAVAAANDSFDGQWPDGPAALKDLLTRHHPRRTHHGRRRLHDARRAARADRRLPPRFSCRSLLDADADRAPAAPSWSMTPRAAVGARPRDASRRARTATQPIGLVVLVHDLQLPGRARSDDAQLPALSLLRPRAAAPRSITRDRGALRLARLDRRACAQALSRRVPPGAFQPLMRDVRELVERLAQRARRGRAAVRGPRSGSRHAAAAPPRRARRHPRQPRALHPREDRRRHRASSTRRAAWSPRSSR